MLTACVAVPLEPFALATSFPVARALAAAFVASFSTLGWWLWAVSLQVAFLATIEAFSTSLALALAFTSFPNIIEFTSVVLPLGSVPGFIPKVAACLEPPDVSAFLAAHRHRIACKLQNSRSYLYESLGMHCCGMLPR